MRRNLLFVALALSSAPAFAQLRIVTMNATNFTAANAQPRAGMGTILSAIGSTISDDPRLAGNSGIARPIDVLCLQEVFTPATTGAGYAALLNQLYGVNTYAFGTMTGATTGNGTQGIIYNTATVQLLGEAAVGTTNSSGMARQQVRHRIRPVGYSSTAADIYIYNGHWKSSSGDAARRLVEAQTIKSDVANNLPANSNVIYLGDMNVNSSTESGYAHLLAAGAGQAFDPINAGGTWDDNASFKNIHTQSPWDPALNPGFNGATGGMDSRFDQQIVTANLNDNEGVAYITNSYFVLGNNGSHELGMPLNTGSGAAPAVLTQLSSILDHLPVSVDYQLPAKMVVTETMAAPPRVIVGGPTVATFRVQNTAPTTLINGADELDYSVAISGAGSASFSTQATTAGNLHNITVDTSVPGERITPVLFVSRSEAAPHAAGFDLSTHVLAHAMPSFSDSSLQLTQTIDFGICARGAALNGRGYVIANAQGVSPLQAAMDIDAILAAGDEGRFSSGLSLQNNIAAGSFAVATASIDTSLIGQFSATYTIKTSEEDLPGAAPRDDLSLILTGRIALEGDADLNNIVDIGDFSILASNFNETSQTWQDGDFLQDGTVNIADFSILAANFNLSAGDVPRSVPEPAAFVAAATLTLLRRRR